MNKLLQIIGFVSVGIVMLWITVPLLFPSWLYLSSDSPVPSNFIVQLLGSLPDRSLQTSLLYHQGFSHSIFIVHENTELYEPLAKSNIFIPTESDLVQTTLQELSVLLEDIHVLPGQTLSTQEEAIAIAKYLVEKKKLDIPLPRQIMVVTSRFHSGRADRIFEGVFKKYHLPTKVNTIASQFDTSNPMEWYKNREDFADALLEEIKSIHFWLYEKFTI